MCLVYGGHAKDGLQYLFEKNKKEYNKLKNKWLVLAKLNWQAYGKVTREYSKFTVDMLS